MNNIDKQDLEIDAIISIVHQCYGYNFKDYARSSVKRRIQNLATTLGYEYVSEMLPEILYDQEFLNKFLNCMSITVTEMFRNPSVFKTIRDRVLPTMKCLPKINIWHAGCSTGEEVYSMAIILHEEGLLDHCQIYATDFNNYSLDLAQQGIYPLDCLQKYTTNYIAAGGKKSFSDYYRVKYNSVKFDSDLKKNIIFSNHNLVKDHVFGEMNIVMCRNVLIYFNKLLQNKAFTLFKNSLTSMGFLVLGEKETTRFSKVSDIFENFADKEKIFRMY